MNVLHLAPRSESPEDVLHRFASKSLKTPFSVELIYHPFVLFRYRVERTPFRGKRIKEEGLFLADLVQGSPMNIQKGTAFDFAGEARFGLEDFLDLMSPPLMKKRTVTIAIKDVPDDKLLPAAIEPRAAVEKAKGVYRYDLMRVTGGLRFRRMDITALPKVKILYYPFWLVYYRDKKRKMRFDVFDGLSNRKERGEIVRSIKIGLIKMKMRNPQFSDQGMEGA